VNSIRLIAFPLTVFLFIATAWLAGAAPITCVGATVSPAQPTSATPIVVSFVGLGADNDSCTVDKLSYAPGVVTIDTDFVCVIGDYGSTRHVNIGVLPAGAYTVHVLNRGSTEVACASVSVVEAPPVPAVTPLSLVALAVLLTFFGAAAIRRL
jgi:hypothetical protein